MREKIKRMCLRVIILLLAILSSSCLDKKSGMQLLYFLPITSSSSTTPVEPIDPVVPEPEIAAEIYTDLPESLLVSESGTSIEIVFRLSKEPKNDVLIPSIANPSPEEIQLSTTKITLNSTNWQKGVALTITGVDDEIVDGNRQITISFGKTESEDSEFDSLAISSVTITNTDDETASVTVSATSIHLTEGDTQNFSVVLNTKPTGEVKIPLSVDNQAPISLSATEIVFDQSNWNIARQITVTGGQDAIQRASGPYAITLATAIGYQDVDPDDVAIHWTDDDTAAIQVSAISGNTAEPATHSNFTIQLATEPIQPVTIAINSTDTSEGVPVPSSVVFDANCPGSQCWSDSKTIQIEARDDFISDGDINYAIQFAVTTTDPVYATLTPTTKNLVNADDDLDTGFWIKNITTAVGREKNFGSSATDSKYGIISADTGAGSKLGIKLRSQPTDSVTLNFEIRKNNGSAYSDPPAYVPENPLTIQPADWNAQQVVNITGRYNGNDNFQTYRVRITTSSNDADYNGYTIDFKNSNSCPGSGGTDKIVYCRTTGTLTTDENGSTADFYILAITEPTDNVQVGVNSGDGTEGSVSAATVTLNASNWNLFDSSNKITITGLADSELDGDISYQIDLLADNSTSDLNFRGVDPPDVPVKNRDKTDPFSFSSTSTLTVDENGTSATVSMKLLFQPTAGHTVQIPLSVNDSTEGSIDRTEFVFTNANWNTFQTVTVTGLDDTIVDGQKIFRIVTGNANSTDPNQHYDGLNPRNINVRNQDNDRFIFITNTVYNGNLGGINGADDKCNNDSNKPASPSGSYRALLVDGNGSPYDRRGSVTANSGDSQRSWALLANTHYYRSDGSTKLFTTDGNGLFVFGNMDTAIWSSGSKAWTGLNTDWTSHSNHHCNRWTSQLNSDSGIKNNLNAIGSAALAAGNQNCDTSLHLICVQQ